MALDIKKIKAITVNPLNLFLSGILICVFSVSIAWASEETVKIHGNKVDINAEKVPIRELMVEISELTGLNIRTGDPLDKTITIQLKSVPIEQCFKRLLFDYDYAIIYEKPGGIITPVEVKIFGGGPLNSILGQPRQATQTTDSTIDVHQKKYSNQWYERQFSDSKKLAKEISVKNVGNEPDKQGVLVTRLTKNSAFSQIGIKKGDRIENIDGNQVNTGKKLFELLKNANKGKTMIRIERINDKNLIDPIYIQLSNSDIQIP